MRASAERGYLRGKARVNRAKLGPLLLYRKPQACMHVWRGIRFKGRERLTVLCGDIVLSDRFGGFDLI